MNVTRWDIGRVENVDQKNNMSGTALSGIGSPSSVKVVSAPVVPVGRALSGIQNVPVLGKAVSAKQPKISSKVSDVAAVNKVVAANTKTTVSKMKSVSLPKITSSDSKK